MIGPYSYGVVPNHTHLSKKERAIWTAFMQEHPNFCDRIWYDVECGGHRQKLDGVRPELHKMAEYLGKYKIDVVGENKDSYIIFEVKGEATTKALGELWLYDDLLREEWTINKPVRCICVTDEEMPNIRLTLEKEGYELIVVQMPPMSSPSTETTQTQTQTELGSDDPSQDHKSRTELLEQPKLNQ